MYELANGDKRMIRMVVGNWQIMTPNKRIMRIFWDKMKGLSYRRDIRKAIYKYALQCHKDNQDMYDYVMTGH